MLTQGIILGLSLSVLVGPLIVALLDASIRQGFRAGMAVGGGIWLSDALFIISTYYGLYYITQVTEWPGFATTLGWGGGVVLLLFGAGALYGAGKSKMLATTELPPLKRSYLKWGLKGFLINTLNPFTVFFWMGVASTILAKPTFDPTDASLFYGGLFGTIVLTDSVKVGLAKLIRRRLTPHFVRRMQQASGIALIIFGIVLIIRTIWLM
jgi:threonine/homoserine/homoserine lactone efflux protein